MAADLPNFRLIVFVDGLDAPLELTPRGEHGGFTIYIDQRDGDVLAPPFEISGRRQGDELVVDVKNRNGVVIPVGRTMA